MYAHTPEHNEPPPAKLSSWEGEKPWMKFNDYKDQRYTLYQVFFFLVRGRGVLKDSRFFSPRDSSTYTHT